MKVASFWKWKAAEMTLALNRCEHEEMRNWWGVVPVLMIDID